MAYPVNNRDLYPLFVKLLENSISDEELQQLDTLFSAHPEMVECYCEFGMIYAAVRTKLNDEVDVDEAGTADDGFDTQLWSELARHEKTAPFIEIPKEALQCAPIQKVACEKIPSRGGRFSLITAVSCAAALVLLALFVHLSDMFSGQEVATLTNSQNAKWSYGDGSIAKGTRLKTGKPLVLKEGLAELQFDNEARFVVEAPAEFRMLSEDRISLQYGQLYATVPLQAVGFIVYTENAKVIDLGTEFGIAVDSFGETVLHTIKGHVQLIAGAKTNAVSIEVNEGTAKRVAGTDGRVFDIPCDERKFARKIDASGKTVWRGEPLELASLIANGNGLDPVFDPHTLNPNTGHYELKPLIPEAFFTNAAYNRVPENGFIDGVFVPDGRNGQAIITSQGHLFDCPATSGKCNRNIAVFYKPYDKTSSDMMPALFDGMVYGSEESPCVLLHSNIGITVDLNFIRQAYPGQNTVQLQTGYGLTWAEKNGRADFFILVDGILKHEDRNLRSRENSQLATIILEPDARFLTFIVTDDQKSSRAPDEAIEFDFFYLLNPQLMLE